MATNLQFVKKKERKKKEPLSGKHTHKKVMSVLVIVSIHSKIKVMSVLVIVSVHSKICIYVKSTCIKYVSV